MTPEEQNVIDAAIVYVMWSGTEDDELITAVENLIKARGEHPITEA